MLVVDAATTRRHLPFDTLIEALRRLFAAGCEVPLRHTHKIATPSSVDATLLIMPAWRPGKRLGIKTIAIHPGNAALGKPGLHAAYLLLDASNGETLALIDGNVITAHRTAAASALAASFLARADARQLLIVGSGRIATLLAPAYAAVRPIERVTVWSRNPQAAAALARRLNDAGHVARCTGDLPAAVAQADIVSCATLATAPLIHGAWLRPGTHLDLIGSFTPAMRESDAECFARSRVFVDTAEALGKSGDVLEAIAAGAFAEPALQGTLADLCSGSRGGRASADEITLFKSVGSALEDLAAAEQVYDAVVAELPGTAGTPGTGEMA
jgi:ornithine cyclodeaminase